VNTRNVQEKAVEKDSDAEQTLRDEEDEGASDNGHHER
jgi:hypothetical protein